MSYTSVRYLMMLRMIPRYPKFITTTDLVKKLEARDFAVNLRSIQRDLDKLSTYFPLQVDERTSPYKWSFDREAVVDVVPALDLPAALTFELAKAYLTPILPAKTLSHLKPHFDEAHRTLLGEQSPLSRWPDRVRVINRGLGSQRPAVDADVMEAVTEALLSGYQCELTYQARKWPEPELIVVHPLGLIFRDPNVYLIAMIEGREGLRQLALHRASSGEVLEKTVSRPEAFDLDQYIKSGAMGVLLSDVSVNLRLRCDRPALNHLLEAPIGADQVITDLDDEGFELTVTLGDSEDLHWWLTSQAVYCDILEPRWLHDEIEQTLERGLLRARKRDR